MTVNQRVKRIRKFLGLTQVEFSGELGIKQGSYSDLERGKIGVSSSVLKTLIKNYRINPIWLYDGDGDMFLGEISPASFNYTTNGRKKKKPGTIIKLKQPDQVGNILMVPDFPGIFPIDYANVFSISRFPSFSIPLEQFTTGNFVLLPVQNEHMNPTIQKGELVFGRLLTEKLTSKEEGFLYLFITYSGNFVARASKIEDDNISVIFDNPDRDPIEIPAKELYQVFRIEGKLNLQQNDVFKSLSHKISDLELAIDSLRQKLETSN